MNLKESCTCEKVIVIPPQVCSVGSDSYLLCHKSCSVTSNISFNWICLHFCMSHLQNILRLYFFPCPICIFFLQNQNLQKTWCQSAIFSLKIMPLLFIHDFWLLEVAYFWDASQTCQTECNGKWTVEIKYSSF